MPPPDVLQHVAEQLDAMIQHEDGFGSHTRLIGVTLDNFKLYIVEVPIDFDDDPQGTLGAVAEAALADESRLNIAEMADQGVIGWFFVQEIRANIADSALTQMLCSNMDNTHRTRMVFGMDLLGRIYHCIRQEGENPKIVTGGQPVMAGAVPSALRALNIAIAEQKPNKDRYLKALAKVEIKTMEEMADFAMTEGDAARGVYEATPPPAQNT